jgi:hypothetical protein
VIVALVIAQLTTGFLCTRAGDAGPSLFWENRSVVMQRSGVGVEVNADEIEGAIAWGAAQWTAIECSDIELVVGAPTGDRIVGFDWAAGSGSPDNHNMVVFRNDDADDPLDAWTHELGALAITTVTFESGTGELLDADIEINDSNFSFTACDPGDCQVQHDLANTLTHELGHVLGLDHPPEDQPGAFEATMFASASEGDTGKRDLADNDVDGICTIYPAGDVTGNCFEGSPRVSPPDVRFETTVCGATGTSPLFAGLPALFAFAQRRRRMRRLAG